MIRFGNPMIRMRRHSKKGQVIVVRSLIQDPMITGLIKNKAGRIPPADFIEEVIVTFNGKPLMTIDWGTAVSRNPYLAFKMRAESSGILKMVWRDNRGRHWSATAKLRVT
ncbi:MAG: thiosulfate oxidation carrier complex protein SoxZ [Acidiferrobacter thiooxydans]|jgi:sulfur-oxidizing protein SoxZ